ncbi:hypothetical protein ABIA69_003920 [Lysinibacillus parviboronicapiens]|uniref:Uncharacterized protein n=1 Tax=Lysinibacillus parviboronicapiens TaxID=436516 RepID=A0ABV2PQ98_9BACI
MRTLHTELMQKGLGKKGQRQASKRRQPKEKMSRREIEELMGMSRDIYQRVNGAFRRK